MPLCSPLQAGAASLLPAGRQCARCRCHQSHTAACILATDLWPRGLPPHRMHRAAPTHLLALVGWRRSPLGKPIHAHGVLFLSLIPVGRRRSPAARCPSAASMTRTALGSASCTLPPLRQPPPCPRAPPPSPPLLSRPAPSLVSCVVVQAVLSRAVAGLPGSGCLASFCTPCFMPAHERLAELFRLAHEGWQHAWWPRSGRGGFPHHAAAVMAT